MNDQISFAIGIGLGILPLIIACVLTVRAFWLWRTWHHTTGEFLRANPKKGEAKLLFLDTGGQQRTAVCSLVFGRYLGRRIKPLRYHPDDPVRATVLSPTRRTCHWLGVLLLAGIGVLWVVAVWSSGTPNETTIELEDLGVSWPLGIGGGLLLIAAALVAMGYEYRRQAWLWAEGTVVSVWTTGSGKNQTTWVKYRFADDLERDREGRVSVVRTYREKQKVQVRYDAHDPDRNTISTTSGLALWWAVWTSVLLLGAVLVVLGYVDVLGQ